MARLSCVFAHLSGICIGGRQPTWEAVVDALNMTKQYAWMHPGNCVHVSWNLCMPVAIHGVSMLLHVPTSLWAHSNSFDLLANAIDLCTGPSPSHHHSKWSVQHSVWCISSADQNKLLKARTVSLWKVCLTSISGAIHKWGNPVFGGQESNTADAASIAASTAEHPAAAASIVDSAMLDDVEPMFMRNLAELLDGLGVFSCWDRSLDQNRSEPLCCISGHDKAS